MEKAFEIQKQVRDNAKTVHNYMTDLQNWEAEMKRKEAALNGEFEQELPPVRSKSKKDKPAQVKKDTHKKIAAFDYKAWDKFDVDKACEDVDMADIGPTSLDGKMSQSDKQTKLREEAQYEKERGNEFVKQKRWDDAIACYNRAIELVKTDTIYYANRGLCHLMKDNLHQAETDCTEALRLDPTYVKALQRRATAREKLGSLRGASQDLNEVLKLEPHNKAARTQLQAIKARMGTKGAKSKSSPSSPSLGESSPLTNKPKDKPKIVELPNEPTKVVTKEQDILDKWINGEGEQITVIKPVKKPPHLRSKRPLKSVPIQEIPLGKTSPVKQPTRLKIVEIDDNLAQGDTNNNDSNQPHKTSEKKAETSDRKILGQGDVSTPSPESVKLVMDSMVSEKDVADMTPPVNSVQFLAMWKLLKGYSGLQSDYLQLLVDPLKIPTIFDNALESDILSDILRTLHEHRDKFNKKIHLYLKGLSGVKRFSALAMFLGSQDKEILVKLLDHCKTVELCSENEIADLKNKYEL